MLQWPISTMPVTVRYSEVGHDRLLTLASLANLLQEVAGISASELGFGEEQLAPHGIAWILARQVLRIERLPLAGEELLVSSWPSTFEHMGTRGYEVQDSSGQVLITGGSAWVVMDSATHRMCHLPEALAARYPAVTRECPPFTCRTLPRLRNAPHTATIQVRRDDLDMNGHVNNARYLPWLLEAIPCTLGDQLEPSVVDISYRAECFPGDILHSLCGPVENSPTQVVHSIQRLNADGTPNDEVCRAISSWKQCPLRAD